MKTKLTLVAISLCLTSLALCQGKAYHQKPVQLEKTPVLHLTRHELDIKAEICYKTKSKCLEIIRKVTKESQDAYLRLKSIKDIQTNGKGYLGKVFVILYTPTKK